MTTRPTDRTSGRPVPDRSHPRGPSPLSDQASRADDPPADPRDGRGREARHPLQIPSTGWKDILLRVKAETKADNLALVAAGVAFYFMLSLFPALIATVSVYGLVAAPATVEQQVATVLTILPREAGSIIADQLRQIGHGESAGLGLSLALSLAIALWSAARGAKALIIGLNIAYEETEVRGLVRKQLVALAFTLGFILFASASLGLIAVLPHVTEHLLLGSLSGPATFTLTWALLLVLLLIGLAAVYRYGPARRHARWQWVSVGSLVAASLWLLASLAFSWYASRFGSFNETYGTLAGGVLLLLWLQITAFVTLLGAEINAEIEHQTAVDSTVGPPKPMGERDAVMADTLGAALGAASDDEGVADGEPRANGSGGPRGKSRLPSIPGSRNRLS
jgi:membrane protein